MLRTACEKLAYREGVDPEFAKRAPLANPWMRGSKGAEEVVLSSGTSPVHDTFLRPHRNEIARVHLYVDALDPVGTGIVQGKMMLLILAADQQQEVHSSRHPEPIPRVQGHRMEGEPKPFQEMLMVVRQRSR